MNGESDELVSLLRLHQTYDTEFAPNYYNNETFMAPAYDLFDPTSPFGRYTIFQTIGVYAQ